MQEAVVRADSRATGVRLVFAAPEPFYVYGTAWEGDSGVSVDNLSVRGHSGLSLTDVSTETLRGAMQARAADIQPFIYFRF